MSRHTFAGMAGVSVAIGWDRPLDTFYVQVSRPDPEDEGERETFVWEGTSPRELPTAAAAIAVAASHAELPADLASTLETDRLKTLGSFDGLAQTATVDEITVTADAIDRRLAELAERLKTVSPLEPEGLFLSESVGRLKTARLKLTEAAQP